MRFTNTNLVNINDDTLKDSTKLQDGIRKADLDLLDKINKTNDSIISLSNIINDNNRFFISYVNTSQSIPGGVETVVNFNSIIEDNSSCVSTGSSWKYTCKKSGYYLIDHSIVIVSGGNSLTNADIKIYKNNSLLYDASPAYSITLGLNVYWTLQNSKIISMEINDTVYLTLTVLGQPATISGTSNASSIQIIKL